MVATGGIYCQFKQAEYILEDLKANVAKIRRAGEAERDALDAQYQSAVAQQTDSYNQQVALAQKDLQDLLDAADSMARQAAGKSSTMRLASTVPQGPPVLPTHVKAASGLSRTGHVPAAATAFVDTTASFEERVKLVPLEIGRAKSSADAHAVGPFAAAGSALDRAVKDVSTELRKGFDSELFGPLAAMVAGLPPPDPFTLLVMQNAANLELMRIHAAKNRWLNDIRVKNDAALEAQSEALRREFTALMSKLQTALDIARLLIRKLRDALDSPGPTTAEALQVELNAAKARLSAPNPRAMVSAGHAPDIRWRQLAVSSVLLDEAVQGALAVANTAVPPKATAAEMAQLASSSRAKVQAYAASSAGAQLESEVRARFAADEKTMLQVLDWIRRTSGIPA